MDNQTNEKQLKSVYGRSEQECFDKRTEIIAGKRKAVKQKEAQSNSFKDWLNSWYQTYKQPYNGERSLESIRNYLDKHIIPALGDRPLSKLSGLGLELQQFINKYSDKPNTQKKIYNVLHDSLEQAYNLQMVKFNSSNGLKLMAHKKQSYRALEIKEQAIIYESIDVPRYKRLFMFCCCTGIRIGRALELTAEDFDKERGEIVVIKKQLKGLREVYRVPYLPTLIDLPESGKIFADITYTVAYNYFYTLFKKLNIKKANIHCFRHTFLSVCYLIGINDKLRQLWAGHSTFEMTMNVYTHLLSNGDSSPILDYLKALKQELKL